MLLKAGRTKITRDMGGFITHLNMPGWIRRSPSDHGHGPLAMVVESILVPGRLIAMHEHQNDEIISWVPDGVMRHDDETIGKRVTDAYHLLVENTGKSYWHSEGTLPGDPHLRMLQIMVRPRELDLEPNVQHGPIPPATPNSWRHLFGPEGGSAPFFVRNDVDFYDVRLEQGAHVDFPAAPGRDLYFYVFTGAIAAGGKSFAEAEQGLLFGGGALALEATEPSVVVAFLIDPKAKITRKGTISDHKSIPPALVIRTMRPLAAIGLGRFFTILNQLR
jgi:redox-sensitive bicupin YhaK (pirin superfamily)